MEECWDHDAEARLTAQCVEERANWCLKLNMCQFPPASDSQVLAGKPVEPSVHQNGTVNLYRQVSTEGDSQEPTGESDRLPVPACNGHLQSQSSQAVSGQAHPPGINGIQQTQQPMCPQDRSASPPPYSALPPPDVKPGNLKLQSSNASGQINTTIVQQ